MLDELNEWKSLDAIEHLFPDISKHELRDSIQDLIDIGALVVQGSVEAQDEHLKVENWEWGVPSAMLHYCEQDRTFASREQAENIQRSRAKEREPVEPYLLNSGYESTIELPETQSNVLNLMAKRRTQRNVANTRISLVSLSDCLFAGMGIVGEVENCVNVLPVSMTPSGGARNPYEAFVYAPRVDGLEPGFYHYSAKEHTLGLVSRGLINNPSALVGDQPWVNDMSCIVFLCADFRRTMWKYQDNNAYRVVLIEAGHIGQNIMLAATEHGMTACPSAALAHTQISDHLGLENPLQSPVYALMIGVPEKNGSQFH